jgi:hypothetical protein
MRRVLSVICEVSRCENNGPPEWHSNTSCATRASLQRRGQKSPGLKTGVPRRSRTQAPYLRENEIRAEIPSGVDKIASFREVSSRSTLNTLRYILLAGGSRRSLSVMARSSFRRLRYAGAPIGLFGLILSVGTWAFRVWLRTHTASRPHMISFTWTLGIFCWVLG